MEYHYFLIKLLIDIAKNNMKLPKTANMGIWIAHNLIQWQLQVIKGIIITKEDYYPKLVEQPVKTRKQKWWEVVKEADG
jgi:hypothetical protein